METTMGDRQYTTNSTTDDHFEWIFREMIEEMPPLITPLSPKLKNKGNTKCRLCNNEIGLKCITCSEILHSIDDFKKHYESKHNANIHDVNTTPTEKAPHLGNTTNNQDKTPTLSEQLQDTFKISNKLIEEFEKLYKQNSTLTLELQHQNKVIESLQQKQSNTTRTLKNLQDELDNTKEENQTLKRCIINNEHNYGLRSSSEHNQRRHEHNTQGWQIDTKASYQDLQKQISLAKEAYEMNKQTLYGLKLLYLQLTKKIGIVTEQQRNTNQMD